MDFGAIPPEVNSARMYAGPGSAPMVAAASAWSGLATELSSAAANYDAIITMLNSEEWLGPASAAMAEAVAAYVAWMSATAAQAQQSANQAAAAAAAFEATFASMVPPPLIAANRAQLAALVSTNVLGLNAAAIAAKETQYGEMWAQDAVAMYSYAASSASASAVTPFAAPPQNTSPAASAVQAAAVAQAAGTSAGAAPSALSQLMSALPSVLQDLSSPISSVFASAGSAPTPGWLQWLLNWYVPVSQLIYNTTGLPYFGIGIGNSLITSARAMGMVGPAVAEAAAAPAAAAATGAGSLGGSGPIAARLGDAGSIGKLSVPSTWAPTGPGPAAVRAHGLQVDQVVEPPEVGAAGNLLGGMPLGGAGAGTAGAGPRYGFRPTVMARPPFAG
ncbi:PPE family protein PPE26 [Mycobacterium simulans]|uniref:PPE family protein PPE26 n=1 Tax=Mycobacterium simulans TaxID=627089 RepID=A0A7Z7IQG7_9MYCO|nr:PPE family protein [Mycobacterium simulans]SOJ57966.1 PPE family protein PPE26 [Mycobacterium simulans]